MEPLPVVCRRKGKRRQKRGGMAEERRDGRRE
jgi:hypothetical protein